MKATKYLLVVLALATGCAPVLVEPAEPLAERFPEEAVDEVARILELEDRRDLDAAFFRPATQSPLQEVRRRALLALGRMGIREGRAFVEPRLWDPDTSVVAAAAFATGLLADTAATQRLGELAAPANEAIAPTVAAEAVRALGAIRTPDAVDQIRGLLLTADPGRSTSRVAIVAALEELTRLGVPSAPWERWLESPHPQVIAAALRAARHDPSPEFGPVESLLESPDTAVRAAAASLLTRQGIEAASIAPDRAASWLEALLADPDYSTRLAAWRAAATLDPPALSSRLATHLTEGPQAERHAVVEGLASRRSLLPQSLQTALRETIEDPEAPGELRADAVRALGETLADQDLLRLSSSDSWQVRAAATLLGIHRGLPASKLRAALADRDTRVGATVLDSLVATASQEELHRRRSELWEAIHHNDAEIRAAAARGIGKSGDPATVPLLLDAFQASLRDTDVIASLAAIDALAEVGLRTGLPTTRAFSARFPRSDDHRVRQRVEWRLGLPAAWGPTYPLETSLGAEFYRGLVDDYIAGADSAATSLALVTGSDTVLIQLYSDEAPLHISRLIQMAQLRFFDGLPWSSSRPGGLLTTGDRSTRAGEGSGFSIRGERTRRRASVGSVGMVDGPGAVAGELFVVLGPEARLPAEYTIVGRVVEGFTSLRSVVAGQRIHALAARTEEPE